MKNYPVGKVNIHIWYDSDNAERCLVCYKRVLFFFIVVLYKCFTIFIVPISELLFSIELIFCEHGHGPHYLIMSCKQRLKMFFCFISQWQLIKAIFY